MLCSLLLCALFYTSAPVLGEEEGKIVGGSPLLISAAPYQISFRYNDRHFCGGTIFNKNYIVTAGHCVAEFSSVNGLSIVAGQTNLNDNYGQSIDVLEMTPHPKYDANSIDYDVAVLRLAKPLVFNENVSSIALSTTPIGGGVTGLVTGWGTTRRGGGGDVSNELLGVQVKTQSWLFCQVQYFWKLTRRMFCAGNILGGEDSCQGDSGGPLKIDNTLGGIVSFGRGCADVLAPGVYTDVSTVIGFIKTTAGTQ